MAMMQTRWCLILALAIPWGVLKPDVSVADQIPQPGVEQVVEKLTETLVEESTVYHQTSDPQGVGSLHSLAKERKTYLELLIRQDPTAFLRVALSRQLRASLPPMLDGELESSVMREGMLEVLIERYANESHTSYWIADQQGKRWSISFATPPRLGLVSGIPVRAKGIGLGEYVVLKSAEPEFLEFIDWGTWMVPPS